jgi:hypothetical protein
MFLYHATLLIEESIRLLSTKSYLLVFILLTSLYRPQFSFKAVQRGSYQNTLNNGNISWSVYSL